MDTRKYYIAYGSNLNIDQMAWRCPLAQIVGTAEIPNYELLFKGSMTGSYLTIEPRNGQRVPVGIWSVTAEDEKKLDRYEGFPRFYYKKDFTLDCRNIVTGEITRITAFAYIMREERSLGLPTDGYFSVCMRGYQDFGLDRSFLDRALNETRLRMDGEDVFYDES